MKLCFSNKVQLKLPSPCFSFCDFFFFLCDFFLLADTLTLLLTPLFSEKEKKICGFQNNYLINFYWIKFVWFSVH